MIAAAILLTVPYSPVVQDRVDVIEVNHYYDDCGKHLFDQAIWWDFDWRQCRLEVRDWRMVKAGRPALRIDHGNEDAFMLWSDGGVLREVRASAWRETWTQYDPELAEREIRPKEMRRELSHPGR